MTGLKGALETYSTNEGEEEEEQQEKLIVGNSGVVCRGVQKMEAKAHRRSAEDEFSRIEQRLSVLVWCIQLLQHGHM